MKIGFLGLLTLVFIVLKLTNYIDWSWVWVLSPLWIPFAFIALFIGLSMLLKVHKWQWDALYKNKSLRK